MTSICYLRPPKCAHRTIARVRAWGAHRANRTIPTVVFEICTACGAPRNIGGATWGESIAADQGGYFEGCAYELVAPNAYGWFLPDDVLQRRDGTTWTVRRVRGRVVVLESDGLHLLSTQATLLDPASGWSRVPPPWRAS